MKTDAEVVPYNTRDPLDLTASTKEGRGALTDWLELGYVSQDRNTRCISRTVEYSFNDFAISQVAAGEKPEDQEKYLRRSAGWQKLWNRDVESLNFTGFLAPKFSNGSFNNSGYDPLYCYGCNWADLSYEGTPWGQFSTRFHHYDTNRSRILLRRPPRYRNPNRPHGRTRDIRSQTRPDGTVPNTNLNNP